MISKKTIVKQNVLVKSKKKQLIEPQLRRNNYSKSSKSLQKYDETQWKAMKSNEKQWKTMKNNENDEKLWKYDWTCKDLVMVFDNCFDG